MCRFATAFLLVALVTPAAAQQPRPDCFPSQQMYSQLSGAYGETRRHAGLSGQIILEVWTNPETGSWTILSTRPDGISCLAAAGEGWADIVQGQPL